MLGEIQKTLEAHKGESVQPVPNKVPNKVPDNLPTAFPEIPESAWEVYSIIKADPYQTIAQMAAILPISDRMVKKHLAILKAQGLIMRIGSNKAGHWAVSKL